MRKTFAVTALAALIAIPLAVGPTTADAACKGRKNTGTVLGAVGGGLLGNAIKDGGTGAVVGAVGGGLLGRSIAKDGGSCDRRVSYRSSTRTRYAATPQRAATRKVYYDQYGNAVGSAPVYR